MAYRGMIKRPELQHDCPIKSFMWDHKVEYRLQKLTIHIPLHSKNPKRLKLDIVLNFSKKLSECGQACAPVLWFRAGHCLHPSVIPVIWSLPSNPPPITLKFKLLLWKLIFSNPVIGAVLKVLCGTLLCKRYFKAPRSAGLTLGWNYVALSGRKKNRL